MQFSLERRLEKEDGFNSTHHTSQWIVLQNGVIDSSILLDVFLICLKMFVMQQRKNRWDAWMS